MTITEAERIDEDEAGAPSAPSAASAAGASVRVIDVPRRDVEPALSLTRRQLGRLALALLVIAMVVGAVTAVQFVLDRNDTENEQSLPVSIGPVPTFVSATFDVTVTAGSARVGVDSPRHLREFAITSSDADVDGLHVITDGASAFVQQSDGPWVLGPPTDLWLLLRVHDAVFDVLTINDVLPTQLRSFVDVADVADVAGGGRTAVRYTVEIAVDRFREQQRIAYGIWRDRFGFVTDAHDTVTLVLAVDAQGVVWQIVAPTITVALHDYSSEPLEIDYPTDFTDAAGPQDQLHNSTG